MKERRSDRWLSIFLSILVHAAIIGAFAFGWWHYRAPPVTPPALAIQATLVGPRSAAIPPLPRVQPATPPALQPAPRPPQPAPQVPPPPSQAELDAQRQAEQAAAAARAKAQAEAAQAAREKAAADAKVHAEALADAQAKKQAQQEAAKAAARAKAEAQAKAQAQAEAAAKAEAEARAKAEAAAKAAAQARAEAEAKAKAAAAAKAQQQVQQQLQAQIAAEERLDQLQSNGEAAQYQALIRAKVERAWIRPPTAQAGIDCVVHVTQVTGGDVTAVQIVSCNGDDAVRQSIEAAVYRASPLPTPPDPALFARNLTFNFRPSD